MPEGRPQLRQLPCLVSPLLEVTHGGVECASYADCARLLDDGEDVAHAGVAGLRLDAGDDPTVVSHAISCYEGGEFVEQSTVTFDLAR